MSTEHTDFEKAFAEAFLNMTNHVHTTAREHGFWDTDAQANLPTKVALLHSEVSELLEAIRADGIPMSPHLPSWPLAAEELADIVIRVMDMAAHMKIHLGEALVDKARYNMTRERRHGKRF